MPELLVDGPDTAPTLVLSHGAGAPMRSVWMNTVARGLAARGLRVVRFEFPYMAARADGRRRPPDREPVLRSTWHSVVDEIGDPRLLVIGGKSMGGRIASMVADELGVAGLVCLGYPFHPPGQPAKLRTAHLATLRTPALIVQGERDPFGGRDEVTGYTMSSAIELCWVPAGDHSLAPPKSSGRTAEANLELALDAVAGFVQQR